MDKIKIEYTRKKYWGITVSVDMRSCNPELIRDADKIKKFVDELCRLIKTRKFGECVVVNFGEKEEIQGYSMVQLVETSLVSGHFANKTNSAYVDVFSCKYFNPYEVADFCQKYFQAEEYLVDYVFRK